MATPRTLLRDFIEKKLGIGVTEAARQLGVTHPALIAWLDGSRVPEPPYRKALEKWTTGAVPADAWADAAERRIVDRVSPAVAAAEPKAAR